MSLFDALHDCLPKTQCRECGFNGCKPYAEAMAKGEAPIDKCPPGGVKTLQALGRILAIDPTPLMGDMTSRTRPPSIAKIDEAECIGCTKCIQACPVDVIIGAGKFMHQVIADGCTGCGLCVEPCPVDCIEMVSIPAFTYDEKIALKRYEAKQQRENVPTEPTLSAEDNKRDYIAAALARASAKKSHG